MNKFVVRQSFILFLTAVIWGIAFVAQSAGMEYVGPFTYNGARSVLGGLVLIPCIMLLDRIQGGKNAQNDGRQDAGNTTGAKSDSDVQVYATDSAGKKGKTLMIGGVCCGVILFAASNFQQFGIQYTSVGKAGFITAMYILLVPLMGLFVHKKVGIKVWVGVGFAVCGLYLLCMTNGLKLEKGDALVLICAFIFALHILVIDHFSPMVDGVRMSCIQFWVSGILSLVCAALFDTPDLVSAFVNLKEVWMEYPEQVWGFVGTVCYGGIMSCGVAYTLQIVGQKGMNPTVASLILSLESVVSVVAGFLILNQTMSRRELLGCCLMVVAIILAQLPNRSGECMMEKE